MQLSCEPADVAYCVPSQLSVLALMLSAVGIASWASFSHTAYDMAAPKRLLMQHAHLHKEGSVTDSMLIIGGSDAVDVRKVIDVSKYQQKNSTYRDWQVSRAVTHEWRRNSRPLTCTSLSTERWRLCRPCIR